MMPMMLLWVLSLSKLGTLPLPLWVLHLELDQQNLLLNRLNQIYMDQSLNHQVNRPGLLLGLGLPALDSLNLEHLNLPLPYQC